MPTRDNINIRLSDAAVAKLRDLMTRRGARASEVIEQLIGEAHGAPAHYYAQQAAFQSYIAVAMATEALRGLYQDKDEADHFVMEVSAQAKRLFGAPPKRPLGVGDTDGEPDPRLHAILEAYGLFD